MPRPITLFTGQWADLPLSKLAPLAKKMGYDGLELACWGDHFDVDQAATSEKYISDKWQLLSDNGLTASHENLLKKYVSENSVKKIKYDADEATSSKEKQPPLPDTSPPLMKREDSPVLDTHDNNNAKSVCLNSNESLFSASEEISLKLKKKVIVVLNKVQYKYANSGPHGAVITDLINEITKLNINNEQFKETLITTIDSFNEKLANSRLLNAFDTLKSAIDDNTVDKEHEQILHCIEEKRWWKGKF